MRNNNKNNNLCMSLYPDDLNYAITFLIAGLPKLVNAPEVVNITCTTLTVLWSRWQATIDIGSVEVTGYE